MTEEVLLTQEGYEKIEAERDELASVKRREVSERLKEAISYGDLSENTEYSAAKEEQAELEERIYKLEQMLRNAKIVNEDEVSGDVINVGLTVSLKEGRKKDLVVFEIVGATEADPFAEPPKISNESPVGKALLGRKKGEKVEVMTPDGMIVYKIEKISK